MNCFLIVFSLISVSIYYNVVEDDVIISAVVVNIDNHCIAMTRTTDNEDERVCLSNSLFYMCRARRTASKSVGSDINDERKGAVCPGRSPRFALPSLELYHFCTRSERRSTV